MIIDFNKLEEIKLKNFNGGEKEVNAHMFIDDNNKIMYGKLIPGASIGMHKHETSSEILYIIKGKGLIKFKKDGIIIEERIESGMCHYCPKFCSHSFINDSNDNVYFLAIVPKQ